MKPRTLGIAGVVITTVCWIAALSRLSFFDLLPTIAERRYLLIGIATLATLLLLVASSRHSRWWLIALVPTVLLFGLLRLH